MAPLITLLQYNTRANWRIFFGVARSNRGNLIFWTLGLLVLLPKYLAALANSFHGHAITSDLLFAAMGLVLVLRLWSQNSGPIPVAGISHLPLSLRGLVVYEVLRPLTEPAALLLLLAAMVAATAFVAAHSSISAAILAIGCMFDVLLLGNIGLGVVARLRGSAFWLLLPFAAAAYSGTRVVISEKWKTM
jgi:hypothetical protein